MSENKEDTKEENNEEVEKEAKAEPESVVDHRCCRRHRTWH